MRWLPKSQASRLFTQPYIQAQFTISLQRRHNERGGVSNPRRLYCLHNRILMHKSKKISKLRVTGLCAWNSLVTGEFSAQRASNAENVSIRWRHHEKFKNVVPEYTLGIRSKGLRTGLEGFAVTMHEGACRQAVSILRPLGRGTGRTVRTSPSLSETSQIWVYNESANFIVS